MSRFLLLFLFLLWLAWPGTRAAPPWARVPELSLFFSFYLLMVLVMGLWSRLLARRVTGKNLFRNVGIFHKVMFASRLSVLAWFGVGVFALDWGNVVLWFLGPVARWPVQLPGTVIATLPALAAWIGLWWAQFPADRALREQSMLITLDEGLPLHAPPGFGKYLLSNLRLQVLFSAVPVLLILLIHDLVIGVLWQIGILSRPTVNMEVVEFFAHLGAVAVVLLFAPEVLRRVLHTQPLPDSPLRRRLEALCREHHLGYRQILLWQTDNNMGNAAVMGFIPQMRYILMSDLLLETMTDAQIEAVFAHEVGHIVHRHMAWYVVFFIALTLWVGAGPGVYLGQYASTAGLPAWMPVDLLMTIVYAAAFLLTFGYVSRHFERQADVFAARTIEMRVPEAVESLVVAPRASHVGRYGASIFASALHRVAMVNNIPVAARSWCHGSIHKRMQYLHHLSADPAHTARFDRFMTCLYALLLAALVAGGAFLVVAGR